MSELVAGRLPDRRDADRAALKGETAEELIGAARRCAPPPRRSRARLSVRRQLRHRRRRVRAINVSTAAAFVAAACGPAGRQARQPLGHLALRLGRRARSARGEARRRRRNIARGDARRDRLLLPVRAALPSRDAPCRAGPAGAQGAHDHEPARAVRESGAPAGAAARRRRPEAAAPVAETLAALGVERALVVHGSGLDEIALHGETQAVRCGTARSTS
jgi:hypothetical protein